jgi:hypothetical protein
VGRRFEPVWAHSAQYQSLTLKKCKEMCTNDSIPKIFEKLADSTFNEFTLEKAQSFSESFQTHRILDSNNLKILTAIGLISEALEY